MADRLGGGRISGEVAAAGGIAPRALRIPMPGLGVELCVLAVRDGLPAGIEEHPPLPAVEFDVRGIERGNGAAVTVEFGALEFIQRGAREAIDEVR